MGRETISHAILVCFLNKSMTLIGVFAKILSLFCGERRRWNIPDGFSLFSFTHYFLSSSIFAPFIFSLDKNLFSISSDKRNHSKIKPYPNSIVQKKQKKMNIQKGRFLCHQHIFINFNAKIKHSCAKCR